MIKTFGTALILAGTLAFGITGAQAHTAPKAYAATAPVAYAAKAPTAPKAYAARVGVKRECKLEHGKRVRCHTVKLPDSGPRTRIR
jgi:hypothetical protein